MRIPANMGSPLSPDDISISWLETANARYRQQQIPPMGRVFKAFQELSIQLGRPIALDSPAAEKVIAWFKANTQPGSHAMGALFTGAFYFDACYWPVTIPIFYGRCRFDPLDSLETMAEPVKDALWKDPTARGVLLHYWNDCFDYALGLDVTLKGLRLDPRAIAFLTNADHELTGAIAQLLAPQPTLKAILGFRMACEIFLKVFLIHERKLTDDDLKKVGHKIGALAKTCFTIRPLKEFQIIERGAVCLPDVSQRYDGAEKTRPEVFDAAFLAQLAASTITRHLSGEDTRDQIFGKQA